MLDWHCLFFDEPGNRLLWVGKIPGEVTEQVIRREERSEGRGQIGRRVGSSGISS